METYKCCECGEYKTSDLYFKDASIPRGFSHLCKSCKKNKKIEYYRTISGLLSQIYNTQLQHSKTRGHNPPKYTNTEFVEKYATDVDYLRLHENWVISGYDKNKIPSFDRKDDSIGYSFENLNKWMTWEENRNKSYLDIRSGKLVHGSKPQKSVIQLSLSNNYICEYVSASEASRIVGVQRKGINNCCLGIYLKSGGYRWMFATDYYK